MDRSYLVKLIQKYLEGGATEEECEFLSKYYDLFDEEEDLTSLMNEADKSSLASDLQANILQEISLDEDKKQDRRLNHKLWISRIAIAASIFAVILVGFFVFRQPTDTTERLALEYNETKNHRFMSLPDGSTVILSVGSKLYYPTSFHELDTREVYLEGQAYFDIKHNSSKPFIIHTGKVATTVLGTAFNIRAWPVDTSVTVTVTRGKVKVNDQNVVLGVITPNQQITYNTTDAGISRKTVDAQAYLSWRSEDLLLEDVTIAEAAKLLETRYDVRFSISEESKITKRFTTTLLKGESLDKVLLSMCEFNGVTYQYDRKKGEVLILSK